MKVNFLILLIASIVSCSVNGKEYLCFSDPKIALEKVCYPSTETTEKDLVVLGEMESLVENVENPGSLIEQSEEMKRHYTPEKFSKSFNKHYKGLKINDVMHTLTYSDNTAVLLKTGATLIYSHVKKAFFFGFSMPIELSGAINYFGSGIYPEKASFSPKKSNCNLERDGVIFISPSKQQLFYSQSKTFCEYKGRFFKKENGEILVARVDQIGQGYTTLHGDFYKFLLWLRNKS